MLDHLLQYGYAWDATSDENSILHDLIKECIEKNQPYRQFIRVFSFNKGDIFGHKEVEVPFKCVSPMIQIGDRIFMPDLEDDCSMYVEECTGFIPKLNYVDIEI